MSSTSPSRRPSSKNNYQNTWPRSHHRQVTLVPRSQGRHHRQRSRRPNLLRFKPCDEQCLSFRPEPGARDSQVPDRSIPLAPLHCPWLPGDRFAGRATKTCLAKNSSLWDCPSHRRPCPPPRPRLKRRLLAARSCCGCIAYAKPIRDRLRWPQAQTRRTTAQIKPILARQGPAAAATGANSAVPLLFLPPQALGRRG